MSEPIQFSPSIAMPEPSPGDARARAREALRDALPLLITEIAWRLSETLDKIAFRTVEACADGSGRAPAEIRDEAHRLAGWLAEMAQNAERLELDWQGLLPPRLHVDIDAKTISFHVASS